MLDGRSEPAREDFRRAVALSPKDADACFFAALCEYQLGRHADAITILKNALKARVADPDIHYLLAESLLRIAPGDTAPALRELDRALEVDPHSVPALVLRAKLKLSAGLPAQAVADLEAARRVEPESRSALYNLGKAYQQAGRADEARELFSRIRQDSGDSVDQMGKKKLGRILMEASPE